MIEAVIKEAEGKGPDDLPSQADSAAAQSSKKVAAASESAKEELTELKNQVKELEKEIITNKHLAEVLFWMITF